MRLLIGSLQCFRVMRQYYPCPTRKVSPLQNARCARATARPPIQQLVACLTKALVTKCDSTSSTYLTHLVQDKRTRLNRLKELSNHWCTFVRTMPQCHSIRCPKIKTMSFNITNDMSQLFLAVLLRWHVEAAVLGVQRGCLQPGPCVPLIDIQLG